MRLPTGVEYITARLNGAGHRADIVGGCVRDRLLGKEPSDYDITTDATPDEMREIFSDVHTLDVGIKHGTLTVIIDSVPYEVTTYRVDGTYSDGRHPDEVSFTERLSDDLARRDFTVNAMCYNTKDGFTDLYFGKRDLDMRIIRAVGDPVLRFSEDALRILRGLRFASTLDFDIEEKTSQAIFDLRTLLSKVSAERIFTEWKKLISGVGAYRIIREYSLLVAEIIPELQDLRLPDEEKFLIASPEIRELSLFALSSEHPARDYMSAMNRLKSDTKRKSLGEAVLSAVNLPASTKEELHVLLVKCGKECAEAVLELKLLLGFLDVSAFDLLKNTLESITCFSVKDMKINGEDLKKLGFVGRDIGITLELLLYRIARGEIENKREELLLSAKEIFTSQN